MAFYQCEDANMESGKSVRMGVLVWLAARYMSHG